MLHAATHDMKLLIMPLTRTRRSRSVMHLACVLLCRFKTDLPDGVSEMNERLVAEAEAGDYPPGVQVPNWLSTVPDSFLLACGRSICSVRANECAAYLSGLQSSWKASL